MRLERGSGRLDKNNGERCADIQAARGGGGVKREGKKSEECKRWEYLQLHRLLCTRLVRSDFYDASRRDYKKSCLSEVKEQNTDLFVAQ
jgi:hypothetical protein